MNRCTRRGRGPLLHLWPCGRRARPAKPAGAKVLPMSPEWNVTHVSGTDPKRCGGEGVSQSPLKRGAFLTFRGQNPPLELRPESEVSLIAANDANCGQRGPRPPLGGG